MQLCDTKSLYWNKAVKEKPGEKSFTRFPLLQCVFKNLCLAYSKMCVKCQVVLQMTPHFDPLTLLHFLEVLHISFTNHPLIYSHFLLFCSQRNNLLLK